MARRPSSRWRAAVYASPIRRKPPWLKANLPADIRDNLEKITGFPGTSGVYTYSADNHNGLDETAFIMVTIEKGAWIELTVSKVPQ